ncbi:hypothetical protein NLG97_g5242 [Lecanicillium saksenae]|uniref:Uncharacterized protein n=1 Tax=Lecanicillium saksenae TaxID=468837 RepID=A0ACC1QT66_9HYPO|nr:hypothetical protein NLG97_g5242 [Lecanicillium saksenae]
MKLSAIISAALFTAVASSLPTVHLGVPRSDSGRPITAGQVLGYKREAGAAQTVQVLGYKRDTGSANAVEPLVEGCDE